MSCDQESQRTTLCVYLQEERKQLFHVCIAPWPLLQSTPFLHYSCPPGRIGHTANLIKFTIAICEIYMSVQSFDFISLFFFMPYGSLIYFRTVHKNLIASIFGTNEECIKANSRTTFALNLMNIRGVMRIYSLKKRSNFCHGYSVSRV